MKVTLIAHTQIAWKFEGTDLVYGTDPWMERRSSSEAEHLITFAGRACYQSFHRPNKATEKDQDYIRSAAIEKGHGSILEHATATFYITGVSRSLTHELIRHRHLSFSELSQRYVNVGASEPVIPPLFRGDDGFDGAVETIANCHLGDTAGYADLADRGETLGASRKGAREAARAVMPNCTETRIVVTGNLRAWRHVIRERGSVHADAEIRELAIKLLDELYEIAPSAFDDFSVIDLPDGRQVIE